MKILEIPALSEEEYMKIRRNLPSELKDILDEAWMLDREVYYVIKLFRVLDRVPIIYFHKVYDRFTKLANLLLYYYDKYLDEKQYEALKNEIKEIDTYIHKVWSKIAEPGRNALFTLSCLKHFLYLFVYIPLKEISEDYDKIFAGIYSGIIQKRLGILPKPSEIIKEGK